DSVTSCLTQRGRPPGLKGGVLVNVFDLREAQKISWLFDRAERGQTETRFRDAPRDAGYHHSVWRTLLPTPAEREARGVLRMSDALRQLGQSALVAPQTARTSGGGQDL